MYWFYRSQHTQVVNCIIIIDLLFYFNNLNTNPKQNHKIFYHGELFSIFFPVQALSWLHPGIWVGFCAAGGFWAACMTLEQHPHPPVPEPPASRAPAEAWGLLGGLTAFAVWIRLSHVLNDCSSVSSCDLECSLISLGNCPRFEEEPLVHFSTLFPSSKCYFYKFSQNCRVPVISKVPEFPRRLGWNP